MTKTDMEALGGTKGVEFRERRLQLLGHLSHQQNIADLVLFSKCGGLKSRPRIGLDGCYRKSLVHNIPSGLDISKLD